MTTRLVRLGIRVRRTQAELALAALLPILQHGAEETEPAEDEIEYAVYAPRAELPELDDVRALAGDALIDVSLADVAPGWERRWHEYLQPVEVTGGGRRLRIRPPWAPAVGDADVLEVLIDPGELFGAGTHPTTRLCLELLLACACSPLPESAQCRRSRLNELEPGGALCDWGAGSGILAITAARLGFGPVAAVEVMPDGLEAIARNAAANGVSVRTHWLNLAATPAPWAPTVTANLTVELLAEIAAGPLETPPERMIASGVLAERAGEIADAFAHHGMREAERRVEGEWAAVLMLRE